ncbi:phage gp6-like head-tail connector protein [Clostridiales bacterium]|nr:phage gp6-like head-tail connector protein [Clostridiales bacterium]
MRISELEGAYIANYLKLDEPDETVMDELQAMLDAAVSFASGYTGLTESELEEIPEMTIAVLTIIGDMHDNRQFQLDRSAAINRTADMILSMHSVNLI